MSCWIWLLLLFWGCGGNSRSGGGCNGNDDGYGRGGRSGRSNNGNDSCGCNGNDNGYGQTRGGDAIPAAWSSDGGYDNDSRSFSGRQDFPSVGRSGDTCGCENQD